MEKNGFEDFGDGEGFGSIIVTLVGIYVYHCGCFHILLMIMLLFAVDSRWSSIIPSTMSLKWIQPYLWAE